MGDNVHLVSMAVIFLSAAAGSVSARCLRANARALSLALIFGGGVFVSAGFIHLLGSAQQAFAADAYPWATFWCSVGVMATLLVEESTIALLRWREAKAKQCKTCPPIASSSRLQRVVDACFAKPEFGSSTMRTVRTPTAKKSRNLCDL